MTTGYLLQRCISARSMPANDTVTPEYLWKYRWLGPKRLARLRRGRPAGIGTGPPVRVLSPVPVLRLTPEQAEALVRAGEALGQAFASMALVYTRYSSAIIENLGPPGPSLTELLDEYEESNNEHPT